MNGSYKCSPWVFTYAEPKGSPLGYVPEPKFRTLGPDNRSAEWLAATTPESLALLGATV